MRNKVTTLFNKNHIIITKEEYFSNELIPGVKFTAIRTPEKYQRVFRRGGYYPFLEKVKYKEITLESPLGFTYKKKIKCNEEKVYLMESKSISTYEINLKDTRYTISYLSSFGSVNINTETRPWELDPSDCGFSDHFVVDLKGVIDNLLEIIIQNKLKNDPEKLRKEIYKDLFGYPEGPKMMTDKEKILSHGFDLVKSFRKRKDDNKE